jgi:hypothetical protein
MLACTDSRPAGAVSEARVGSGGLIVSHGRSYASTSLATINGMAKLQRRPGESIRERAKIWEFAVNVPVMGPRNPHADRRDPHRPERSGPLAARRRGRSSFAPGVTGGYSRDSQSHLHDREWPVRIAPRISRPSLEAYAARHDWKLIVSDDDDADGRPPAWAKIPLLARLVREYELLAWIDADAPSLTTRATSPPRFVSVESSISSSTRT